MEAYLENSSETGASCRVKATVGGEELTETLLTYSLLQQHLLRRGQRSAFCFKRLDAPRVQFNHQQPTIIRFFHSYGQHLLLIIVFNNSNSERQVIIVIYVMYCHLLIIIPPGAALIRGPAQLKS